MKRLMTLALLASAASPVLAAPAPVSDLNTTSSNSAQTSQAAESSVQRLERLLQNSNRVQANLQQQVDDMSLEISELRGALEQSQYDSNQMVVRQKELFIELDKLRTELAELKESGIAAAPVAAPSEPASSGTYTDDEAEKAAYQKAVDLVIKERDYDAALVEFEAFNKDYPQSVYSANSNYWLGQLYYTKKQDVDAAKAFAVVVSHQDSNKRADSLVKLGEIAARNNNATAAKKYFQQVIEEYANSASANKADERLKALN